MTPDTLLLSRIRSGDEQAFTELYQRHYKVLFYKAYLILDNVNQAKDAVMELFIRIWDRRRKITASEHWLDGELKKACDVIKSKLRTT